MKLVTHLDVDFLGTWETNEKFYNFHNENNKFKLFFMKLSNPSFSQMLKWQMTRQAAGFTGHLLQHDFEVEHVIERSLQPLPSFAIFL